MSQVRTMDHKGYEIIQPLYALIQRAKAHSICILPKNQYMSTLNHTHIGTFLRSIQKYDSEPFHLSNVRHIPTDSNTSY